MLLELLENDKILVFAILTEQDYFLHTFFIWFMLLRIWLGENEILMLDKICVWEGHLFANLLQDLEGVVWSQEEDEWRWNLEESGDGLWKRMEYSR